MKIAKSIQNYFRHNTKSQLLAKGVGLAALGLVGYDAHYLGKMQADLYSSEKDASSTAYFLNNTLYSTNMSKVQEGVKNASYNMELDCAWKRFINEGVGYVKGFTSMLVEQVVPLGLGIGALFGKGNLGKICAGGLGLYGAYEFLRNFLGWGTPGGPIK